MPRATNSTDLTTSDFTWAAPNTIVTLDTCFLWALHLLIHSYAWFLTSCLDCCLWFHTHPWNLRAVVHLFVETLGSIPWNTFVQVPQLTSPHDPVWLLKPWLKIAHFAMCYQVGPGFASWTQTTLATRDKDWIVGLQGNLLCPGWALLFPEAQILTTIMHSYEPEMSSLVPCGIVFFGKLLF